MSGLAATRRRVGRDRQGFVLSQRDIATESFELESRFERVILCERRLGRFVLFEVFPMATGASAFVARPSRCANILVRKLSFRTNLCASSLGAAGAWPFARALRGRGRSAESSEPFGCHGQGVNAYNAPSTSVVCTPGSSSLDFFSSSNSMWGRDGLRCDLELRAACLASSWCVDRLRVILG